MLQSMWLPRVGLDWVTEEQQNAVVTFNEIRKTRKSKHLMERGKTKTSVLTMLRLRSS